MEHAVLHIGTYSILDQLYRMIYWNKNIVRCTYLSLSPAWKWASRQPAPSSAQRPGYTSFSTQYCNTFLTLNKLNICLNVVQTTRAVDIYGQDHPCPLTSQRRRRRTTLRMSSHSSSLFGTLIEQLTENPILYIPMQQDGKD